MKTLNINEKINVRSNILSKERKNLNILKRAYRIAKETGTEGLEGTFYYHIAPSSTVNQLGNNPNFQRSLR